MLIKLWIMLFFRHSQWYKNSTPVPQRSVSSGEVWVSPTSCYFETSAVQHSEKPHFGRQAGGEYEFLISVNYLVFCLLLLFTHGCNVYLTMFHWFGWEFLQRNIVFNLIIGHLYMTVFSTLKQTDCTSHDFFNCMLLCKVILAFLYLPFTKLWHGLQNLYHVYIWSFCMCIVLSKRSMESGQ